MPRSVVTAAQARAVGPYSHGVVAGDLLLLSGMMVPYQALLTPSTRDTYRTSVAVARL